jgi:CO/xanthine dehydrogenase FAD-binding subunit
VQVAGGQSILPLARQAAAVEQQLVDIGRIALTAEGHLAVLGELFHLAQVTE